MSTNKNISIRLSDYENDLVRSLAELNNKTISEFVREQVLEVIEKAEITKLFNKAYATSKRHEQAQTFEDAFDFAFED